MTLRIRQRKAQRGGLPARTHASPHATVEAAHGRSRLGDADSMHGAYTEMEGERERERERERDRERERERWSVSIKLVAAGMIGATNTAPGGHLCGREFVNFAPLGGAAISEDSSLCVGANSS